jgi:hypothetical protein
MMVERKPITEEDWPERTRPIRCFQGRATHEPCMEPATVEIMGFDPHVSCEQHARYWLEDGPPEGWEEFAVSRLWDLEGEYFKTNPILALILEGSRSYLELYELGRAREKLEAEGGTPQDTAPEREYLELARKYRERAEGRE